MKKSQMTLSPIMGASSASPTQLWNQINWSKVESEVKRLQVRIAKAIQEKRYHKAKALQWLLAHSRSAKLLAVKRVSSNKGRNTPGVDGETWNSPKQKWQAAMALKRRGYRALPLRRIYIPKKNGKRRPLGIPTMRCRAMQALHLQGLLPIAETTADPHSYGFRPYRSCADAIEQCFVLLSRKISPEWVPEADIKACFDRISHSWLRDNIPMDKTILNHWLQAGYCEKECWFPMREGTPQGGIVSPTLANMVLDGLQTAIEKAAPKGQFINVVRYADDFVVTGRSKQVLTDIIKPAIEQFLQPRGLELSQEKTRVSHINDGFDFLGFNLRKYKGKLLIKPAKKNVLDFLANIREIIKAKPTAKTANLIRLLNPKIQGWANYYRHVVSKQCFDYVDYHIGKALWRWVHRRHTTKGVRWKQKRYYCTVKGNHWRFCASVIYKEKPFLLVLKRASNVANKRHIKIRSMSIPFSPEYEAYLAKRKTKGIFSEMLGF